MAHRVSYDLFNEKLKGSEIIDHICMIRKCINPEHLRIVDAKTNAIENSNSVSAINSKKLKCINGHDFDEQNTRISGKRRVCRACKREKTKIHMKKYRQMKNKVK